MRWREFEEAAPELSGLARERIERFDLILLGTTKADGSPRISPVEAYIVDGDLMLGMMWQSKKALDLLRDPRCVVHNTLSDKKGTEGEAKLIGRALDVPEPARRTAYGDRLEAEIDWRPGEPYHLFTLDVERAWFIRYDPETDRQEVRRWPG